MFPFHENTQVSLSTTALALIVGFKMCMHECLGVFLCACTCPLSLIVACNNAPETQPPGVLPERGGPQFFIKNCYPAAEASLHHIVTERWKGKHMRPVPNLQMCPSR